MITKLLLAVSTMLLLNACNQHAAETGDNKNEKRKQNNMEIYKALETGDVSKLNDIIADDAVDHTERGDIHGKDSIIQYIGGAHTMLNNLKMDVKNIAFSDDYSFSLVKIVGTVASEGMGKPVGSRMESTGIDLVKWKGDKAVEHWSFMEQQEMMKMMQSMGPGVNNLPDSTHN